MGDDLSEMLMTEEPVMDEKLICSANGYSSQFDNFLTQTNLDSIGGENSF